MTSRSRHGPPPLPGASDDASGKSSDAATSETTAVAGSTRAPGASHCSSTSESGMSVRSMRTAASAIRPGAPGARALLSSPGSGIPGSLLTSSTSESDTRSTQSPGESMGSYKRPGQAGHSQHRTTCRPFSGKEGGRIKMHCLRCRRSDRFAHSIRLPGTRIPLSHVGFLRSYAVSTRRCFASPCPGSCAGAQAMASRKRHPHRDACPVAHHDIRENREVEQEGGGPVR